MTQNVKVYPIGTKFRPVGRKHGKVCTVTDILKTYNSKNQLVKVRYVATYEFAGQTVTNYDVVHATIFRGIANL